jgi:ATP-binding cassette subfamily B protein
MEENSLLTSILVESVKGIETVKNFSAEAKTEANTGKKLQNLMDSSLKESIRGITLSSLTGITAGIGGILILWLGAYNIMEGNMTAGELLSFNALLAYFIGPVRNLIDLQPMIQTAVVAANRLGEILDLEIEKGYNDENKALLSSLNGDIEFKDVSFRYGFKPHVLKNISITIPAGQKIAFVGESGSGKTTLAKLILNFYSPESGEVLICGHNTKDIGLSRLRSKIAFISQDVFIFSGTIKENIAFGHDMENLDMEEIINVSKLVKADEFIDELPLKYDTFLEENGANLSEGQKQRLAIARALLNKPDILILDEATSNLDTITENHIKNTINLYEGSMTVIIIAHRLSTVINCDNIFVLDKGQIIESGNHDQLMDQKGHYYNMCQS